MMNHHMIHKSDPFFMMLSTPACHAPFTPAPQYSTEFSDLKAPRTPSFNKYSKVCLHSPINTVHYSATDDVMLSFYHYKSVAVIQITIKIFSYFTVYRVKSIVHVIQFQVFSLAYKEFFTLQHRFF